MGFSRAEYEIPINYPWPGHPQAWASGAMPFLLIALLGVTPDAFSKRLRIVRLPPIFSIVWICAIYRSDRRPSIFTFSA